MIELDKAETGLGYVLQAYRVGGPYMNVITLFGLLALVIAVLKIAELISKKPASDKYLGLIKMAGSLALAVGFMSQIIGIVQALEAIRAAADISPQIVMGGAIVSFYAPIWGFMVFIFSMLFYYILKEVFKGRVK
jgi:biopolymer transport protein ExbB/TolQ